MKAVVMSIAVLMVVVLLGCTEQSQMTESVAMSNDSSPALVKASQEFKVDTKVVGPGGFKYAVVGTIDYTLKSESDPGVLVTTVALKIAQSGSEEGEKVFGSNATSIIPGPGKTDFVSETYAIGSVAETPLRVWIQYSISYNIVSLNDLRIVDRDVD
jgi:hypothetical protein